MHQTIIKEKGVTPQQKSTKTAINRDEEVEDVFQNQWLTFYNKCFMAPYESTVPLLSKAT